jgi:hypothetical protein
MLPLSKEVRGGFMIPEIEGLQSRLREDVIEANRYAVCVANELKANIIDLHYYFHNQIQRRAKDGIHWDATAHRRITNLLLHHICDAFDIDIPGRIIMKAEVEKHHKSSSQFYFDEAELEEILKFGDQCTPLANSDILAVNFKNINELSYMKDRVNNQKATDDIECDLNNNYLESEIANVELMTNKRKFSTITANDAVFVDNRRKRFKEECNKNQLMGRPNEQQQLIQPNLNYLYNQQYQAHPQMNPFIPIAHSPQQFQPINSLEQLLKVRQFQHQMQQGQQIFQNYPMQRMQQHWLYNQVNLMQQQPHQRQFTPHPQMAMNNPFLRPLMYLEFNNGSKNGQN